VFFVTPFYVAGVVGMRSTEDLYKFPLTSPTSGEHNDFVDNFVALIYGGYRDDVSAKKYDGEMRPVVYDRPVALYFMGNSLLYGILGALGAILIASLGAYSITKIPYKGSYLLFLLIFSMIFFPPQVYLIPLWDVLRVIGLYNTTQGMLLVYMGLGVPFATFILRNHFITISKEILESARMDGASELRIWATIVMPLAKPALAVCFIFVFNHIVQDFIFATIMLGTGGARPIIPFIHSFVPVGIHTVMNWPVATVGALFVSIPTIAVFIAFQKYFVRGILMGAVKK